MPEEGGILPGGLGVEGGTHFRETERCAPSPAAWGAEWFDLAGHRGGGGGGSVGKSGPLCAGP